MNAIDTNVFVYAFDHDEPVKSKKAKDTLDKCIAQPGSTVLLWQVAGEFLNCARRRV